LLRLRLCSLRSAQSGPNLGANSWQLLFREPLEALQDISGYHIYTNSANKKGYSGTAILAKTKPLSVTKGIGTPEHDQEGRVLTAEFKDYFLVTTYVPLLN